MAEFIGAVVDDPNVVAVIGQDKGKTLIPAVDHEVHRGAADARRQQNRRRELCIVDCHTSDAMNSEQPTVTRFHNDRVQLHAMESGVLLL